MTIQLKITRIYMQMDKDVEVQIYAMYLDKHRFSQGVLGLPQSLCRIMRCYCGIEIGDGRKGRTRSREQSIETMSLSAFISKHTPATYSLISRIFDRASFRIKFQTTFNDKRPRIPNLNQIDVIIYVHTYYTYYKHIVLYYDYYIT